MEIVQQDLSADTQGPVLHQTLFLPAQFFAGDDRKSVAAVALKNIPAQIALGCGAGESAQPPQLVFQMEIQNLSGPNHGLLDAGIG